MHAQVLIRPALEQHALSCKLVGRTGVGRDAIIFDLSTDGQFAAALRTLGYRFARAGAPDQACCVWHDADCAAALNSHRDSYIRQVHASVRVGGWALIATAPIASAGFEQALGRAFRRRETHRERRAPDCDWPQLMEFHVFERVI